MIRDLNMIIADVFFSSEESLQSLESFFYCTIIYTSFIPHNATSLYSSTSCRILSPGPLSLQEDVGKCIAHLLQRLGCHWIGPDISLDGAVSS
jgi:hypothetical protein